MLRTMLVMMIAVVALAPVGCATQAATQPWVPPQPSHPPAQDAVYLPKVAEPESPIPSAVETTLVLQEKYSRSLEDLQRERDRNRELSDEKARLLESVNKLQAELAKAQQELGDANTLLVQVRQELEKWKNDVLGFREEMRQASKTQIDALAKVMNLLGAEASPAEAAAKMPVAGDVPAKAAPATPAEVKKMPAPPVAQAPAASPRASTDSKENVPNVQRR
jgi:hypothetical protein